MTPHSEQWTFKSQNSEVCGVLPQIAFLDSNKTRSPSQTTLSTFHKVLFFFRGFCFFALVSTSFTTLRSLCFFETSRLVRFNPTLFAFPEQRCQNIKGMYFSQQLVQNNTEKRSHGSYQVVENSREKHSKYIQMVEIKKNILR